MATCASCLIVVFCVEGSKYVNIRGGRCVVPHFVNWPGYGLDVAWGTCECCLLWPVCWRISSGFRLAKLHLPHAKRASEIHVRAVSASTDPRRPATRALCMFTPACHPNHVPVPHPTPQILTPNHMGPMGITAALTGW